LSEITEKICIKCGNSFPGESETCSEDGSELVSKSVASLLGTLIDERYRIIALLGHGGVGAVYKAEQEALKQMVALKMLHPSLIDDPDKLQRFEQEGKALSTLSHINVISAHNYGVTTDLKPYLVMQFVEGQSLDLLVKSEGPVSPIRAVNVFLQICDGLIHAHRKGIVHRDLKPDNILLVQGEGASELVKLVDFGIAKLLPDSGMIRQKLTQTGHVFGSPSYMSPEQWRGKQIDARSDIYSLGVAMYETLSGRAPFEVEELLNVMLDHMEIAPEPPSNRRTDVIISPELEAVVLKAIQVDLDKRYQSVVELKEDLELTPEGGLWSDRLKASRQKVLLDISRQVKRIDAGKVKQICVILLVVTIGALLWMSLTPDGAVTSSKLQIALKRIYFSAADPRLFDSENQLASLYLKQGKLSDATAQYKEVIARLQQLTPPPLPMLADTYDNLAYAYSQLKSQRPDEIEAAENAIKIYDALGIKADHEGKVEQAVKYYRRSVDNRLRIAPSRRREVPQILFRMGDLETHLVMNNHDNKACRLAEQDLKMSLGEWKKVRTPDYSLVGMAFSDLGLLYVELRRYEEAASSYENAVATLLPIVPIDHLGLQRIVNQLSDVAAVLLKSNQVAKAIPLCERVAKLREQAYGFSAPQTIDAYSQLAGCYQLGGKVFEAEQIFKRVLSAIEKNAGSDQSQKAYILQGLASCESYRKEFPQALVDYQRVAEICRKMGQPMRPLLIVSLSCQASVLDQLGRAAEAAKVRDEQKALSSAK
jgi:serine/threonine protein kinase